MYLISYKSSLITVDFSGGLIPVPTSVPGQSFIPQNDKFVETVELDSGFKTVELIIFPHIDPDWNIAKNIPKKRFITTSDVSPEWSE